jgi:hypothetical protein
MISSRILRNIGSTGNRLMNETGQKERTMVREGQLLFRRQIFTLQK